MTAEDVERCYRIGFDRTMDLLETIEPSGEQWGEDICEIMGICLAALQEIADRWNTDQKGALKVVRQLL